MADIERLAKDLNASTGAPLIYDEDGEAGGKLEGFICPECGEPVYFSDWDWDEIETECPICGVDLFDFI